MKWFQHHTDELNDAFIIDLISKYKGDGYLAYFGTVSIMAKNFNIGTPGYCKIPVSVLRKNLQFSKKKLKKFLEIFQKNKKIYFKFVGNEEDEVKLNCPKLKRIADRWTQSQLKKKR